MRGLEGLGVAGLTGLWIKGLIGGYLALMQGLGF